MNNIKKYLAVALVAIGATFTAQGIASTIKFNAIKPNSSAVQTDEQQGILAVRTTKASVVNIIGLTKLDATSDSGGISVKSDSPQESVAGTGFIIDASGLVVTNNHVVDDSTLNYSVILPDGTSYPATILGTDKFDDVALLKINAKGLVAATLGDSDSLETGQTVFAIGNALGQYQDTVTRGVVSGLGRAVNEFGDGSSPTTHNWIQTDAAINPGNSGGPLINLAGQVIGMNTLIDTDGQSLGFAIPINFVKDAVNQLKTFGTVSRPYLGVQFETITPQVDALEKITAANGAIIKVVVPSTPAATAGLQVNDIVIAINNNSLSQNNELDQIIQTYQAGNQVTFKILRNGKEMDLPVVLGQLK